MAPSAKEGRVGTVRPRTYSDGFRGKWLLGLALDGTGHEAGDNPALTEDKEHEDGGEGDHGDGHKAGPICGELSDSRVHLKDDGPILR